MRNSRSTGCVLSPKDHSRTLARTAKCAWQISAAALCFFAAGAALHAASISVKINDQSGGSGPYALTPCNPTAKIEATIEGGGCTITNTYLWILTSSVTKGEIQRWYRSLDVDWVSEGSSTNYYLLPHGRMDVFTICRAPEAPATTLTVTIKAHDCDDYSIDFEVTTGGCSCGGGGGEGGGGDGDGDPGGGGGGPPGDVIIKPPLHWPPSPPRPPIKPPIHIAPPHPPSFGLGLPSNPGRPMFKFPLGKFSPRQDAGALMFDTSATTNSPWDPAALYVPFIRTGSVQTVDIITNSSGVIQQVKAPDGLVNLAVVNSTKYHMQMFYDQNVYKTNGVYGTNSSAFVIWTVECLQTNGDAFKVTESRPNTADRYLVYTRTNINGNATWQLTNGGSPRTVVAWQQADQSNTNLTHAFVEVKSGTQTLQKTESTYVLLGGHPLIKQRIGGEGSQTNVTTYTYGTNNLVERIDYPGGGWECFAYDTNNRVVTNYSGIGNAPPPSDGSLPTLSANPCKVTAFIYSPQVTGDSSDQSKMLPRLEITFLPSTEDGTTTLREVSRLYRSVPLPEELWEYRCPNPEAAYYDSANLVTRTIRYSDPESPNTVGRIQWQFNPDGTASLYTYEEDSNGVLTNVIADTGQPDNPSSPSSIANGIRSQTLLNSLGQPISARTMVITDGNLSAPVAVSTNIYSGPLGLDCQVIDLLAGLTNQFYYDCCGLSTAIGPDGTVTTYDYDALKRQVATLTLRGAATGTKTTNILDAAGRVIETRLISTNGASFISQARYLYDILGRVIAETNALGGVTIHTNRMIDNRRCVTNTFPDGGTRVETYYRDGRLESVSGTAASPMLYQYGVEQADGSWREFTLEIKVGQGGATNEWVKTYTDGAGRAFKTVYAAASGSPASTSYFNGKGQLTKQVDPDGIVTLFGYNDQGEQEYTATDVNQNDWIDLGFWDRVTRNVGQTITNAQGVLCWRSSTYVWPEDSSEAQLVAATETTADGRTSLQITFAGSTALTNRTTSAFGTGGTHLLTNTAPDGSYTVTVSSYGLPSSASRYAPGLGQLSRTTYGYDRFERQSAVTDARNGTAWYELNDAGQVTSVTTPAPAPGQPPQMTTTDYDKSQRAWRTVYPDGTALTNYFSLAGQITNTIGSRTYPVAYSFDPQGRLKTMKTWRTVSDPDSAAITTWNYDLYRGWLTNKADADGKGPIYSNTPAGRLAFRAWACGTNTLYTYNTAGDLSQVDYSDGATISYGYTRRGQLNTVTSGSSVTSLAYEPSGQLLSESWSGGILDGLLVTNSFDHFLRRTNLSLFGPSSALLASTAYGYGPASRPQTVSDGTNTATYSYIADSPLVSQITFTNKGQWRMTTTRQHDFLNRLTSIASVSDGAASLPSFAYVYNLANQRVRCTLSDGSFWIYEYDRLGQLKSAKRYWPDWTPVAGQQFEYAFDDIGNRTSTKAGGDENGLNLRSATYGANSLNQYTNRTVPGAFDILGLAFATNTVTVNGQAAYRRGEYFHKEISTDNSGGPVYPQVTVSTAGTNVTGHFFLPKSPENFSPDADGNLIQDGRWSYTWDAENRLVAMEALATVPDDAKLKLEFAYDWQGRRISKVVYTNNSGNYAASYTNRFVYDGWNLIATLNSQLETLNSFTWGLDLSGTLQGAGGVGGLLWISGISNGEISNSHFAAFDGNGNVAALVNSADGTTSALYEYGPFGETIRRTGPMAEANPLRFSTKYQDDETELVYYGYRYYSPSTGKWHVRDPVSERGGLALNAYANNQPTVYTDWLGMRPIHFEFNAFIPGPPDWMPEPPQIIPLRYWFQTDKRTFLRPRDGTARLRTEATIESKLIGASFKDTVPLGDTVASPSRRYDQEKCETSELTATASGGATVWPSSTSCQTTLTMGGSAKYPFTPPALTPSIDYWVTWTLKAIAPNRVLIVLEGSHDKFPAYEAVVDWSVAAYRFTSPDSGPDPINLNTSVPFKAEKEIEAETSCCTYPGPP